MKAVIADQYGAPAQLRLAEVDRPVPGEGQVLIRVHAASVHADVWHMVRGVPYALRLMGGGLRRPANPIPGTDAAGVIEALGPGTSRFQVGDPVFGEVVEGFQWRNGATFAEYVAAPESALERIPDGVSFVDAAAVPTSALIALFTVRNEAKVRPGERVLVNGAAGAVGQFVVQIARSDGAHVTAVERTDRMDLLDQVGADEVLDGTRTDFTAGPHRYDVIVDIPGNHSFAKVRRVLSGTGRYILVGHDRYGAGGHRWLGSIPRVFALTARSAVSSQVPRPDFSGPGPGAMADLAALVSSGAIHPVVGRTYPLDEAVAALEHLESGQARGKVVLTMVEPPEGR
ncbi:MAG: NAD(P)-dependent alcohol dehydrogenase [Candidatus Nanopelagicales bacterium]|nr:NAD(P)-dependent alcohol dehydrogenase [Candidatus Nanopelagicales bacterium]